MNDTINILDNIRMLQFEIRIWSGQCKLYPEDLKLAEGSKLPPETLAKLGSKLIMDPDKLSVFRTLKQAAVREALSVGTRFLGGYAIPVESIGDLMVKLNALKKEFDAKKEEFLNGYEDAVQEWIAANPGWENVIEKAEAKPADVRSAISFSSQVYNVTLVEEHQEGLAQEVSGMAGQLRHEIELLAKQTWKQSYQGQREVGQKALRPLRAMVRKIEGLVFLEPGLNDLIEGLKETLAALPSKGVIKGRQLAEACGILSVLGNIPEASTTVIAEALAEAEAETEAARKAEEETTVESGSLFQQKSGADTSGVQDIVVPAAHIVKPLEEVARPTEWF